MIISAVVCFFGLNFDTKINIRFWFNDKLTLENVSLFTALAATYLMGVLTFIPSFFIKSLKNKNNNKKKSINIKKPPIADE